MNPLNKKTIIPMSSIDKNLFILIIKAIDQIMIQNSSKSVTVNQINKILIQSEKNASFLDQSKVYYNDIFRVLCNSPYSSECFQCSFSDPIDLFFSLTKPVDELMQFINDIPLSDNEIDIPTSQFQNVDLSHFNQLMSSINLAINHLPKFKEKTSQLQQLKQDLEMTQYFLDHPNTITQEIIRKEMQYQKLISNNS